MRLPGLAKPGHIFPIPSKPMDPSFGLFEAVKSDDVGAVRRILDSQAVDVNISDSLGRSPLWLAASLGRANIVSLLTGALALTELEDNCGVTPLDAALRNGHLDIVQHLLTCQASSSCHIAVNLFKFRLQISTRHRRSGLTPLCWAARLRQVAVVRQFVEFEVADVNQPATETGECPLLLAVAAGSEETVSLLLAAMADPDVQRLDGASAVHLAVAGDSTDCLARLISGVANLNRRMTHGGHSPLHLAASAGRVAMTTQLTLAGADVDALANCGSTALALAAKVGHFELALNLSNAQADPTVATHLAAKAGRPDLLRLLIGRQADVDLQIGGATPLYLAAQAGQLTAVKALTDDGLANPNLAVTGGYSPLFVAAQMGHTDIVRCLVTNGLLASPDTRVTTSGATPLHAATIRRQIGAASQLIRAGADVNARRRDNGQTPLHAASRLGNVTIARLLAANGGDLLARDRDGLTAFQSALQRGHVMLARELKESSGGLDELASTDERSEPTDSELSLQLHNSLLAAGFHQLSACLHSCVIDVTEALSRARLQADFSDLPLPRLGGSFADAWGRSLAGEFDNDIEVTLLRPVPGVVLHIQGLCRCGSGAALLGGRNPVELSQSDGSLTYSGDGLVDLQRQSFTSPRSSAANRPTVRHIPVLECCRWPPIRLLNDSDSHPTQISDEVLSKLRDALHSSRCYAMPCLTRQTGTCQSINLQVCTELLEQKLISCLTTVQGQVFILLKYIFDRLLVHLVRGLPSSLSKMLLFRMLNCTPRSEWRAENLLHLLRQSLQALHNGLAAARGGDTGVRNLFQSGVSSGVELLEGHSQRDEILGAIAAVIHDLPNQLDIYCRETLQHRYRGRFLYQPFLLMPDLYWANRSQNLSTQPDTINPIQEYHQLYDLVEHVLTKLSEPADTLTHSSSNLNQLIDSLPSCLNTVQVALRVMTLLKSGDRIKALEVIKSHRVQHQHAIEYPSWSSDNLSSNRFVANRLVEHFLWSSNSVSKFCFRFAEQVPKPMFNFLPERMRTIFPIELDENPGLFLMNFDALLKCLHFELEPDDCRDWFSQLLRPRTIPDVQQVVMTLQYCKSANVLLKIIGENEQLVQHSAMVRKAKDKAFERLTAQRLRIAQELANSLVDYFSAN